MTEHTFFGLFSPGTKLSKLGAHPGSRALALGLWELQADHMEIPVRSLLHYTSVSQSLTQSVCKAEAGNRKRESEAHHSSMNTFFRVSIKPVAALGPTQTLLCECSFCMCVCVCGGSACTCSCVFTCLCQCEKPLRFWWLNLRLGQTPLDILFTPCKLLPNVP